MHYRQLEITDLPQVAQLYMEYYNTHEDGEWTEHTTTKRIRQVLTREDSYCLVLEDGGNIIAFAMGYFQQYDDGFTYDLVEIVVSAEKQNQGIGSAFMAELEKQEKAVWMWRSAYMGGLPEKIVIAKFCFLILSSWR